MITDSMAPYQYKVVHMLSFLLYSGNLINVTVCVYLCVAELSTLSKLEALDVSDNELSGSMELQGKLAQIFLIKHKICGCNHVYASDLPSAFD